MTLHTVPEVTSHSFLLFQMASLEHTCRWTFRMMDQLQLSWSHHNRRMLMTLNLMWLSFIAKYGNILYKVINDLLYYMLP